MMAKRKAKLGSKRTYRKSRIGKTNRVPKTRCSRKWTEAAFWAFIRSGLRRMSMRWRPIVMDALIAARRKSKSKRNPRLKWQFQCAICEKWKSRKYVQVDHIEPVGSLTCAEQAGDHINRLFCEVDNLQVVCRKCHKAKTDSQAKEKRRCDSKGLEEIRHKLGKKK
jgi:5-methylcytosine-specific restriction endonuclease McrA